MRPQKAAVHIQPRGETSYIVALVPCKADGGICKEQCFLPFHDGFMQDTL